MTRTDVHSPKNLVTEDYDFFSCGWFGTSEEPGFSPLNTPAGQALLADGWRFAPNQSAGMCYHCGVQNLRYYAILMHRPSHTLIRVGETCLDNRFERATEEFQAMRKNAQLDRERQRILKAKAEFVAENPDLAWLDGDEDDVPESVRWSEFVWDIRRKFQRYADLSEKQVAAIRRTFERSEARQASKPAEPTWVEVPAEGRQEVTGEVIGLRSYEDEYNGGLTWKMLVKVGPDSGAWKLWVTVPRKLFEIPLYSDEAKTIVAGTRMIERGETVTIKVTVTKTDDLGFAKGSRPTVVTK